MEEYNFGDYLMNPSQIRIALDSLDKKCEELEFFELFELFQNTLGIKNNEGFPITAIHLAGPICRARLNDEFFNNAENVKQIGTRTEKITQGRANPSNIPIFYGANSKKTAAFEVLQDRPPGDYHVTIGCWESDSELRVVNFVDGSDADFSKIPFVHSLPKKYLEVWPELPRESASLIIDYFNLKFKMPKQPGLYNVTNVLAAFCYSLKDLDGIGYGATSSNFEGYNIALKDYSKLRCMTVEKWFIRKQEENKFEYYRLSTGIIQSDGSISWPINYF